ncbi:MULTISPECIES: hypothetical protein [unclassified Pseudomonas]|uniref:hypothetical protein n=1 Tax=unclassified Pseudomonas TaxID=196821 RepID=UPI002AC96E6B|nr:MULTISPECIES: hypothetical protein [unclassified Pseudomonas]MEB0043398.1 hypothetical protein [Pseudomonas sp. MH10]MEB0080086.1 hypothetical protein [Pseudomonas sp. MH10out]MEB0094044.1 hypothetical protein [Pseudomonas sp. CCI4.2]MEB0103934.1 hypothetical protein [Pseudomonas sp. CCI3.2]MEB0123716.1 hypothetical protein [Pseudomonas sp. CCI1.2]
MSLQSFEAVLVFDLAHCVNSVALLATVPAAWFLQLTRRREQREVEHLASLTERAPIDEPQHLMDISTLRLNRFNYRFGFGCLMGVLLVSWISTRL